MAIDAETLRRKWHIDLRAGVVFNWDHPIVRSLVQRKAKGKWYVRTPSQGEALIWSEGAPAPKPDFKFAGNEVFELHSGFDSHGDGDVWNCLVPKSDRPEWNEHTYWPETEL
jgi:hypothetical protein